jgi:hypothetical protein
LDSVFFFKLFTCACDGDGPSLAAQSRYLWLIWERSAHVNELGLVCIRTKQSVKLYLQLWLESIYKGLFGSLKLNLFQQLQFRHRLMKLI